MTTRTSGVLLKVKANLLLKHVISNFICFILAGCLNIEKGKPHCRLIVKVPFQPTFEMSLECLGDCIINKHYYILGPLNNLKESMIQFSKPRKLTNKTNPVSNFTVHVKMGGLSM